MFETLEIDVIIHLAAVVGGIGANPANPGRFFYDNATMGIQLMELARRFGVEKFLSLGTICVYPKNPPISFRELCRFRGKLPWDPTKPHGQPRRCLDTSGARELFGFQARTPFRDGLCETIAWYEENRERIEADIVVSTGGTS